MYTLRRNEKSVRDLSPFAFKSIHIVLPQNKLFNILQLRSPSLPLEHDVVQPSENSSLTTVVSSREETGSKLRVHDVTAVFNDYVFYAGRSLASLHLVCNRCGGSS